MSKSYPRFELIRKFRGQGSLLRSDAKLAEVAYEVEIGKRQMVTERLGRSPEVSDIHPVGHGNFSIIGTSGTSSDFSDGETLILRLQEGTDVEVRILNKNQPDGVSFAVAYPGSLLS